MITGLTLVAVGAILFAAMLVWAVHTKDYSTPKEQIRYYGCLLALVIAGSGIPSIFLQIFEVLTKSFLRLFGLA